MKITQRTEGQSTTISPEGRIDTVTAPELEEAMSNVPGDVVSLTFDFAKVEYISSAGLRVLLVAQKNIMKAGASMSIANVAPAVKEVFDITGFSTIFTIV